MRRADDEPPGRGAGGPRFAVGPIQIGHDHPADGAEMKIPDAIAVFRRMIDQGGPRPEDHRLLNEAVWVLHEFGHEIREGEARRTNEIPELGTLPSGQGEIFGTMASNQGFTRLKPHGYAWDFELIERIYNRSTSHDDELKRWDAFFHASQGAAGARDRAAILTRLQTQLGPSTLLSVGCGPGLDVRDILLGETPPRHVTLLDNDEKAIARARANLSIVAGMAPGTTLEFVCRNAFRWKSDRRFDLIWSSGLFDYLNDKTAVFLLKRLRETTAPRGHVVVGNFAEDHVSRPYMETIGEWYPIHRSPEDLIRLAVAAGFEEAKAEVIVDDSGVNLFLVAEAAA